MAIKARVKSAFSSFIYYATTAGAKLFGIEVVPNVDIYVNYQTGDDTSGDGSKLNPYKTHAKAFAVAVAGQTIYGYRGRYIESAQWAVKDGVNYIGGGRSLDKGTVIIPTYTTPYIGDRIVHGWAKFVSLTDTHETLGNNFSNCVFLGCLNPSASLFVCNRSNVVIDCDAYDFHERFVAFQARKDYSTKSPPVDVLGKTFPYGTGNKVFGIIDNCTKWNPSNEGGTYKLGTDNVGAAGGAVLYGGQNGFEFSGKVINNKRGRYQEGYTLKANLNGHNFNDNIHDAEFIRPSFNQYFGGLNIENWGAYGGVRYQRIKCFGGGIDFNNGAKAMSMNPTSTYCARVSFSQFVSDVAPEVPNQIFNVDGSVASTTPVQKTAITLEAISVASNNFEGADELADVEVEFCSFKNYSQAYYSFVHTASSAVRRFFFRNNLLINSGRGYNNSISGTQGTAVLADIVDSHNTSYNTNPNLIDGYTMGFSCQASNIALKNNIHVGFTGRSPVRIEVSRAGGTLTNFSENGNLYWNCGNSNVTSNAGGGAATGITASNLTPANPNFVDAANENFKLTANITGVDAGVDVDYVGNPRHATTPTVGAHEYA